MCDALVKIIQETSAGRSDKGEQYKVKVVLPLWLMVIQGISDCWVMVSKEECCYPSTENSLQEQLNSIITQDYLETLIGNWHWYCHMDCAIKQLKVGNLDGKFLMSDHTLYVPAIFASKMSCLFTALLRHGHVSEGLHDSIIQPIPNILPCQPTIVALH